MRKKVLLLAREWIGPRPLYLVTLFLPGEQTARPVSLSLSPLCKQAAHKISRSLRLWSAVTACCGRLFSLFLAALCFPRCAMDRSPKPSPTASKLPSFRAQAVRSRIQAKETMKQTQAFLQSVPQIDDTAIEEMGVFLDSIPPPARIVLPAKSLSPRASTVQRNPA